MTQVKLQQQFVMLPTTKEDTKLLCLTVTGHAGYAPRGKDIVCAAESILVQAMACALDRLEERFVYDFSVDGTPDSGCVGITIVPTAQGWERVRGIVENTMMGFQLLARNYPSFVSVEYETTEKEERYAG